MKRIFALIILTTLSALLMACGGTTNQPPSTADSSAATTSESSEDAPISENASVSDATTIPKALEKVEEGKTASIKKGKYTGGKDIPAGSYVLTKAVDAEDSGIVSLSSPEDDLDNQYPSKIYEFIAKDDQVSFFISLEEGGILDVPFSCEMTAVDYSNMKINDSIVADAGMYIGGLDVPEGKYILSYDETHEGSGIIWLSEADDDLTEEYPSKIYEFISKETPGTWYISLGLGEKLYLPFACNSLTRIEPLNMEGGPIEVKAGMYFAGEDIPVGKYTITCKTNDYNSGIAWVSAPEDNLKEDYPSVLYEFQGKNSEETYYISFEEGAKMYLPCDTIIETDEGVVFD